MGETLKKAVVLSSPGLLTGGTRRNTARSPGAYIVADRLRKEGYNVQNIEYITEWLRNFEDIAKLQKLLIKHFKDGTDNVLALSITVGHHDILQNEALFQIIKQLKSKYKLRIAAGGVYRPETVTRSISEYYDGIKELAQMVDAYFIGRSLDVFSLWLRGEPLYKHFYFNDGYSDWYKFKDQTTVPEPPIVMTDTGEADCWNENDVLSIELGVGCKFNCSFCTTPFKKTDTLFQTVDNLVYTLSTAYEKYGVTHFNIVDETSNEVDEKYENLLTAVRQLDFQPHFTGYARLDMVAAKPYQIEQMAEIGIKGLFFGIETFNEKAAKMIRKGGPRQRLYDALKEIKTQIPDLFRYGAFIIGLSYDNEKDIRAGFDYVLENELLHNFYMNALTVPVISDDDYWASDISKNPEKFGYEITGEDPGNLVYWKNDWTDWDSAVKLRKQLQEEVLSHNKTRSIGEYNNWEYLKDKALGSVSKPEDIYNVDWRDLNKRSFEQVRKYIDRKSNG